MARNRRWKARSSNTMGTEEIVACKLDREAPDKLESDRIRNNVFYMRRGVSESTGTPNNRHSSLNYWRHVNVTRPLDPTEQENHFISPTQTLISTETWHFFRYISNNYPEKNQQHWNIIHIKKYLELFNILWMFYSFMFYNY